MKTVGIAILQENSLEEEFTCRDEAIQKLLKSPNHDDMIMGRILLLKKYPIIIEKSHSHWRGNYDYLDVDNTTVEELTPIKMLHENENGAKIVGFVIQKILLI